MYVQKTFIRLNIFYILFNNYKNRNLIKDNYITLIIKLFT